MKIKLLVVGKTTDSLLKSLILNYKKRIKKYVNFEIIELNIPKFKKGKKLEIKKKEGNKILEKISNDDQVFLLDEKGYHYNSIEFAKFVENKTTSNEKSIVFIIGGAYGFSDEVYLRSKSKISLSKMTFSHQIIRLFIVEQLYRAFTIINNHPYHNK
tara:strand:- start:526 stop:996 length:471 start_codon:yes stop_codon:yes gene_type:complete